MEHITWIAAVPAVFAALAVVLLPGLIATAPIRSPLMARVALAGAASILLTGAAGVLAGCVGMPFAVWQPFVLGLIAVAVLWRWRTRTASPAAGRVGAILLSWAAAAVVLVAVAFGEVPFADLVSQTYDNVFHLSAVAEILAGADASSLTLRTLIETDAAVSYYPAAWHSLVVLTVHLSGASIPVAANAAWLAVAVAVWIPGMVWLTQTLISDLVPRGRAALVALPLTIAFGGMPYALLSWGTLYPTFLATALLPAAVAAPLATVRAWQASPPDGRRRILTFGALATAGAVLAVAFAQPRVLVSWALLLAVPTLATGVRITRSALRRGGRARRRTLLTLGGGAIAVLATAAVGWWYVVTRLGLFDRPLEDRLGGPQARAVQDVWTGWSQVLGQSWLTGGGAAATFPAVAVAVLVVVGIVGGRRHAAIRRTAVTFLLVALLYVLAAGSDDVVTKLATALWYKDRFRLASLLPILAVPLAVVGAAVLAARVGPRFRAIASVVIAWGAAGSAALTLSVSGTTSAVAAVFDMPPHTAGDAVVSRAQSEFYATLPQLIPAGQRVLGDPWDGAAWTRLYGEREPVFPHVNGQWDAHRQALAWRLEEIGTDPTICAALDALRVRYVVYTPHAFGGGDPAGNHFPGPHAAVEAGLLVRVAGAGETSLYRIDQCGPL